MMRQNLINWISTSGRLLGALFYYEPTDPKVRSVLDFFQQADWQNEWIALKNPQKITALLAQQDNLSEEYQRLFIGPDSLPAPPWGSVYLDPESVIFGNSLLALRAFLQQHQIEFRSDSDEPEDHIGLMLMLSAYLAEHHADLLAEFLQTHFLIWATHFLQILIERADATFYQGLALLTQQTVQYWQQQANLQVPAVNFSR